MIGSIRTTVVTYFNPAVALLLGVTVLGEPFTIGTALGFALILAGSFLATSGWPAATSQTGEATRTDVATAEAADLG
jgi:drug/metabolite transporter (DMT)-like permease